MGLVYSDEPGHAPNGARTHLEILEQVVHSRVDVERVEPEGEHTRLTLALSVKVLDLGRRLVLLKRRKTRPCVEQVGNECKVELGVAVDHTVRRQEAAAPNAVGVLQHLLGTLVQVLRLEGPLGALVGLELVEQDGVVLAVRDVASEVLDPTN